MTKLTYEKQKICEEFFTELFFKSGIRRVIDILESNAEVYLPFGINKEDYLFFLKDFLEKFKGFDFPQNLCNN